jgi:hypothetical protein
MVKAITRFTKMMNLAFQKDIHGNEPLVIPPNPQHINLRLNIQTTSNEELE